ncbi:methyltransferase [Streptomyces minutiscleroticus]|uniref:Methyltransferase n=1 Tax=Streptomyces minutiscleroticus TaxID=68238 RepID=A0A918KKK7_9ACTN|nr:methyltransferase [Streptomyces minutiscleroticus]GGX66889.1 hypothetical protein GCM10010358_21750 [Streptomyces minutiscleroticus]
MGLNVTAGTAEHRGTPDPAVMEPLARILFGHAAFQYLNAGCELGLFDLLADRGPLEKREIGPALSLEGRAADILLLGCTSLGLLGKSGERYALGDAIRSLLDAGDWQRFKDTVAFEQHIVYEAQADFTESLRENSNVGLRRISGQGRDLYHRLAGHPRLERVFYRYMRSWSELANEHLTDALREIGVERVLDCGGGDAVNALALARSLPGVQVTVLEIANSVPVTEKQIINSGAGDRVRVVPCDMFADAFPGGHDCVLFAHQLVIWTPQENVLLLRKAYEALPPGGHVVIFNSMSDDTGDGPVVAALDSVYFASLPAEGGMIYSWAQHEEALREAGFAEPRRVTCPGWTPHGLIIATKQPPR